MKKLKTSMAISELSKFSDVPVSSIKFYIRKGLLHKPIKTGGTRGRYTARHLNRLKLVKKMKMEGLSLSKIKEIIQMMDDGEETEPKKNSLSSIDIKSELINSAITLFREKGYDVVTIADIVDSVGIGCSTFYKHFKNKKDLFIESIRNIIADEAELLSKNDPDEEKDVWTFFGRDAEVSLERDPLWREMMKILRAAAISNPEEFAGILEDALQLKIDLFKKRIQKGLQLGYIRELNQTLLAVMILGIQEYCSEYFYKVNFNEAQKKKLLDEAKDIVLHGILKR